MFGGSFPDPRDFQHAAHESLRQGARDGHKCQLVMAPTGAGKTYLGLRVANEANKKGKRAIFMCDRQALINQTYQTAMDYGMTDIGVIMGDDWQRSNPNALLQIASAQTIQRRQWPKADVIIIDEAHTQMPAWTEHIPTCDSMVIGLSATPFSTGLGKLFSNLINATTMHKLTESRVLVPMRVVSCVKPDMVGAATSGGEWTSKAAGERGMEIVGDVVLEWKKHAENRKTIVFGSDIKHCESLANEFNSAGIMACLYTSKTTQAERREILKEYRKTDSVIRVLISVEALAKGFDVPDVGVVVDCRPLRKSLSTAIQMWGRGARSCNFAEKNDFLLIDHSGNFTRFAEDFENIYFNGLDSLNEGEKLDKAVREDKEERELKSCPKCGYSPFFKTCMSCGFEKVQTNTVEHEDGVGVEIQTGLTAPKADKAEKQAFYSQLLGYQEACGYSHGWTAHKYKEKFGVWPRGMSETPVMPGPDVARWIKHQDIKFHKSKAKRTRLTGVPA